VLVKSYILLYVVVFLNYKMYGVIQLVATLRVVGVSSHLTPDLIAEMKSRRIECPGLHIYIYVYACEYYQDTYHSYIPTKTNQQKGTSDPKERNNSGAIAIFSGFGDTIDTLMEPLPKMWDELTELLKFSTCWPSDL
jgi:hypothetical protein